MKKEHTTENSYTHPSLTVFFASEDSSLSTNKKHLAHKS